MSVCVCLFTGVACACVSHGIERDKNTGRPPPPLISCFYQNEIQSCKIFSFTCTQHPHPTCKSENGFPAVNFRTQKRTFMFEHLISQYICAQGALSSSLLQKITLHQLLYIPLMTLSTLHQHQSGCFVDATSCLQLFVRTSFVTARRVVTVPLL